MKFAKFKNNQQSRWELTWVILKHKRNVAKPIVSNDKKTSIRRYTFAYLLAFCKREPFDYLFAFRLNANKQTNKKTTSFHTSVWCKQELEPL